MNFGSDPLWLTLLVTTGLLIVATLLPMWRNPAWWVRAWEFPRLQLVVIGLVVVIAGLALQDPAQRIAITAINLVLIARHLWWVWPYTPLHVKEVKRDTARGNHPTLSLLCANVLMTSNASEQLIRIIRRSNPDVVLTLETDQRWENELAVLHADYPHRVACPLDNLYGMHLYSKHPLIDPKVEFLVEHDIPSIHTLIDLGSNCHVRAHFLHPAPPSPTENDESTERDAELLLVGRDVADYNGPLIVAGDLNDVAWSHTTLLFRRISGLLDPRVGRGFINTFHAKIPLCRWPLDHIFHSNHFLLRRLERMPPYGSDHFAILAELSVPGYETGEITEQEEDGDQQLAREMIEQADPNKLEPHAPRPSNT